MNFKSSPEVAPKKKPRHLVFKIEAKYQLPQLNGLSHSLGVFYDRGKVDMENPTSTFKQRIL